MKTVGQIMRSPRPVLRAGAVLYILDKKTKVLKEGVAWAWFLYLPCLFLVKAGRFILTTVNMVLSPEMYRSGRFYLRPLEFVAAFAGISVLGAGVVQTNLPSMLSEAFPLILIIYLGIIFYWTSKILRPFRVGEKVTVANCFAISSYFIVLFAILSYPFHWGSRLYWEIGYQFFGIKIYNASSHMGLIYLTIHDIVFFFGYLYLSLRFPSIALHWPRLPGMVITFAFVFFGLLIMMVLFGFIRHWLDVPGFMFQMGKTVPSYGLPLIVSLFGVLPSPPPPPSPPGG